METVGKDPRFSNKGNYDIVKNNCQVYAQAVRDYVNANGLLKHRLPMK